MLSSQIKFISSNGSKSLRLTEASFYFWQNFLFRPGGPYCAVAKAGVFDYSPVMQIISSVDGGD